MRYTLPLLFFVLFGFTASQAEGYELGQGWHSGDFYVSGYANVDIVDRFDAPTKFKVDDLSLFAGGHVNQWANPFMEIELTNHTLIQQGGGAVHGDIVVERLYNDALLSEHNTLRVGKMLTPVGDWNMIHAAPLVPLITRPYTTALGFDVYTTGFSIIHDSGIRGVPDIQLYGDLGAALFARPARVALRSFRHVFGGHINMPFGLIDKVGVSFQSGQYIETGEKFTLYGVNANQSFGKLSLQSAAITARFSGTILTGAASRLHNSESGIYALADYAITTSWHAILEGEYYQDHTVRLPSRSTSVTLSFRPSAPTVWKLEYTHQAGVSASFAPIHTGLKLAFSTLF
ncbi:MAG: hypothetical protein R8K48_01275 [Gallionella sp.]